MTFLELSLSSRDRDRTAAARAADLLPGLDSLLFERLRRRYLDETLCLSARAAAFRRQDAEQISGTST